MPEPRAGEKEKDFVERCIPVVLDDGTAKDGEQAAAICHSMWREAHGGKAMQEDALREPVLYYGGSVKTLGGGKVGGYLVRFTTPDDPDLVGEFFTRDTDYGDATESAVYYQHGADPVVGKRRLGKATLRPDDFGVWAEAQLNLRDEYEKFIYQMADQGKMAYSSGTAPHLVEYQPAGKATWIKAWPLGLDATLTPTPAEPRNTVIPLKAYLSELQKQTPHEPQGEPQEAGEASGSDGGGADATKSTNVSVKETKMEEEKNTSQTVAPTVDIDAIVKEAATKAAKAAADEAVKAYQSSLPEKDKSGVEVTEDGADRALKGNPYKSFGEFLMDVKDAAMGPVAKRLLPLRGDTDGYDLTGAMGPNFVGSLYGAREQARKAVKQTGLNEGIGSQGGFLVDTDRQNSILARVYDVGNVLQRVSMYPVGANSNGMTFNAENETSRADGSRRGGIQAYWLAEAGTKTSSKPEFRQIELKLKKVAGLVYATDELLQDAVALEAYIMRNLPEELNFKVEDAIFNGTGVGMPLGIMASGCLVSVAKETGQAAATIVAENIMKMWSRLWVRSMPKAAWYINQDVYPQLWQLSLVVGTGGTPLYQPPGGLSAAPYGTLMGRPVYPVEYAQTLGTTGDILLADMTEYLAIEKGGIQSASSIHVNFVYDETVFRFVYRVDGEPAWNSALTPKNGTNTVSPFVALATRA